MIPLDNVSKSEKVPYEDKYNEEGGKFCDFLAYLQWHTTIYRQVCTVHCVH